MSASNTTDVCGCRVVRLAGVEQFFRCPVHAAAPEMLAVLRRFAAEDDGVETWRLLRALLARVDGEGK